MCKKGLKMGDEAYLDRASAWSKDLTRMKARGPGDLENAMRQISREYKIEYGVLWRLRYRREQLKTISASVYEAIRAAYREECKRQLRKLENEITRTKEITGPDHAAVLAVEALVGKGSE